MAKKKLKTVTKEDLYKGLAVRSGLSQKQAQVFVDKFIDEMRDNITNGDKVSLTHFGSFRPHWLPDRYKYDPQRKKKIFKPARMKVSFVSAGKLKNQLRAHDAKKGKTL